MNKSVFKITTEKCKNRDAFCDHLCTKVCSIFHYVHNKKVQQVFLEENELLCFQVFQHNIRNSEYFQPFIINNECIQIGFLRSINSSKEIPISLQIDTAAQVSVMSLSFLNKHFKGLQLITPVKRVTLLTADNRTILISGTHNFEVSIGNKLAIVQFYVIKQGQACLLGLPDIIRLGLKINFELMQQGNFDKTRDSMQISSDRDLRVYSVDCENVNLTDKVTRSQVMQFSPQHKIEIQANTPMSISLICRHPDIFKYLYSRCLIWDCDCIKDIDYNECNTCIHTKPILSSVISPQATVLILYTSSLACCLEPNKDLFTALVNPSCMEYNKYMKLEVPLDNASRRISKISVEAPGFVLTDDAMYFDPGFISTNGQTEYKFTPLNEVGHIEQNSFLSYEQYDLSNLCVICEEQGQTVFCNLNNEHCESLLRLKQKVGVQIPEYNQEFFEFLPDNFQTKSCLLPLFLGDQEIYDHYCKLFPHFKETFVKQICNSISLHVLEFKKIFHFLIIGKYPSSMEVMKFVRELTKICSKEKLTEIIVVNFETLSISKQSFERNFLASCKVYFVNSDILHAKMFDIGFKEVRKVRASTSDIVAQTTELSESPGQLLNILIDCPIISNELRQFAEDMHLEADGLTSLWSMNSNEIGSFHERVKPYRPIVFKYPIRQGADLLPKGSKACFVSPQITPVAIQMIEKLLSMDIIERGYCLFAAPTHFIPKTRPELSMKSFIERGGKQENYVAGLEDTTQPPTCRMVHDFFLANQVVFCDPVHQMSPLNQLKSICYSTKYISQLDVTACYHSFFIDSMSKQLSGFESGITHIGRLRYRKLPMGLGISKSIQDSALLHVFSGIPDVLLYSDNILILIKTKELHLQAIKDVFQRLRSHGLRLKPNKTSLFVTKRIKLYGVVVCLQSGKISPEGSKIAALRNRSVPKSRKEMKSFLGALVFFSQIAPIAIEEIAILHRSTRGEFKLTDIELEAYEKIQIALHENNLLFSFRPDYNRKFYMSVDSSNFHSSWVVFNLCDLGHPRVTFFGFKTWGDGYSKLMPIYKELHGIVEGIKSNHEKLEHSKGCVLYTDSLPVILCAISAVTNAKMARIKIYLQSLSWLELSFSPGISPILSLPDYLSRKAQDASGESRSNVNNDCEISKCLLYKSKICSEDHYKPSEFVFLIDSLMNLEESKIPQIREKSVRLVNGKLVFELDEQDNYVKEAATEQNSSPVMTGGAAQMDALRVGQVTTRSKSPKSGFEDSLPNIDLVVNPRDDVNPQDVKDNNLHTATVYSESDQTILSARTLANESTGRIKEGISIKLGEFSGYDPQFSKCSDIAEYFQQGFVVPNKLRHKQPVYKKASNKLDSFFTAFVDVAEYLDLKQLFAACVFDPFWNRIIEILKTQKCYIFEDKTFFIYKSILMCKLKYKNLEMYRIVIPDILSHSFIYLCHRHFLCIKGNKLANQIRLRFEIRNMDHIISFVVKNCNNCSLTAKLPCGTNRQSLPKSPFLLRNKFCCWSMDEVQICSPKVKNLGFNKLLVGCDNFSHFLVVAPIFGNLNEQMVCDFIQRNIVQVFGPPLIISSDNASNINSDVVKKVCAFLGIHKATTAPFSPRGNLSELLNRIIIDVLRNVAVGTMCSIENAVSLISPVVHMINGLVFNNEKVLSPFLLTFGELPRVDILNFYSGKGHLFKSKQQYLKTLVYLQSSLNAIRVSQIENRKYKAENARATKYYEQIIPGAIVSISNPDVRKKVGNYKLLAKFNHEFVVVKRTASSCFVRPCSEINMKSFLEPKSRYQEQSPLRTYKIDVENLKFLSNVKILSGNRDNSIYNKFLQGHKLPDPLYFYEGKFGAELLNFEQLVQDPNFEKHIEHNFEEDEEVEKKQVRLISEPILKSSRKGIIIDIVKCLKQTSLNERSKAKVLNVQCKKVSFNENVFVFPLVKPQYIYFAKRRQEVKLNNEPVPVLKTFRSISGMHFCSCNLCRVQMSNCGSDRCDLCYG